MEMKVMSPQHPLNLFFYSTPSSPRFSSSNYEQIEEESEAFSSVPFSWELSPGIPKSRDEEFDFSGQLDMMVTPLLSSADELFDAGIIKPLKPPPRLESPIISSSKFIRDASLSPRQRNKPNLKIEDPFEAALIHTSTTQVRGRERDPKVRMKRDSNISRKGISRSLSPLRVSEFALLQQQEEELNNSNDKTSLSSSSRGGSKKWRLKDLFLFRSASEGTGTSSGVKKYSFLSRRNSMDNDSSKDGSSKGSSFRSTTSRGSVSKPKGGGQTEISAHERHYTAKRAVSEDLKKKTSLPYRHVLLGCLGFNPIVQHLSNPFPS